MFIWGCRKQCCRLKTNILCWGERLCLAANLWLQITGLPVSIDYGVNFGKKVCLQIPIKRRHQPETSAKEENGRRRIPRISLITREVPQTTYSYFAVFNCQVPIAINNWSNYHISQIMPRNISSKYECLSFKCIKQYFVVANIASKNYRCVPCGNHWARYLKVVIHDQLCQSVTPEIRKTSSCV